MKIMIDEAIKTEENIAEENQRVVDTGIVFDDVTIDMLYCDDTEVIEEHLANYQRRAEEHRQLAEWLKELKSLKEKDEPKAVRYEGDGYADGEMVYDMAFCPNCEHEFEEDSENWMCDFCPNCGQRLRWEE